jgi:hypothetical protein
VGRTTPSPAWPLVGRSERESELWELLWRKPQALMWERFGLELEVALYVRRLAEAEEPESRVNLSTLVRQMADSLGLTTPGMRANRWRIPRDEEPLPAAGARPGAPRPSARSRLKVVPNDAG